MDIEQEKDVAEATTTETNLESAPAAPKKATRSRRKTAAAEEPAAAEPAALESVSSADSAAPDEVPAEPAKAPRRSRSRKATAAEGAPAPATAEAGDTATAAPAEVPEPAGEAAEPSAAAVKAPARRRRSSAKAQSEPVTAPEAAPEAPAEPAATAASTEPAAAPTEPAREADAEGAVSLSPVSVLFQAPDLTALTRPVAVAAAEESDEEEEEEEGEQEEGGRRRRRSRGRRSRNRSERDQGAEETSGSEDEGTEAAGEDAAEGEGVVSRRRRRRRRGDQDLELTGTDEEPNTVTRVRAPRTHADSSATRVASVKGSTRLEAKKQRRRESRESGRRRHVITEAEFLARRESVDRTMVVRQRDDRIQIGVLEDGILAEHFVSKTQQDSLIGNVYLGKVQNVLPSMEAAFVDIGRGRNAVLYAGEVNWDAAKLDGAPRRIEHALKSGDSVLVQVTKDPVGHKGARLTSQISLPGRYLVYVPGGSMTGISRKLPDVERNRLKRILKDRLPENAGVIVRTAAEGASEEELTHDINRLRAQWEGIESQAGSTKVLAPELLYGEPDLTIKVVRDVFNEDFSKLIVSGDEAWDTIEAYVTYVAPDLVDRLEKWTSEEDIFAAHRIDEQIHKALERKVFLPSGGSLVIDRTEAMTVVDVNTGKFTGSGGNLEETVTKNNLEAAEEVVRQLRLRDIGGIIVIDFIDMVLESNRDLVLRRLVECLGRDRTKHQVAEVTSLGLVQMTRKRMGTGLLEVFGEQCEACAGRGVVTHDEPVEHRRAHTVAAEHHQQRTEQPKSTRGEKRRSRGRGQAPAEQAPVEAPVEVGRQAKAEATRAALATIAAAAHAAHREEEHAGDTVTVPVSAVAEIADVAVEEHANGAVLTIGGEKVVLPFAEHAREAAPEEKPKLSLDILTSAFDTLEEKHDEEVGAGRERGRRGRRHRSASRAQGAANETSVEQREAAASADHSHEHVAAPPAAAKAEPQGEAPIILGVGVPASDL
ncbi:Rne/Rng family ribonuclease [Paenarthrobacter sp. DKR-5]|uniref:Rne/Rng family ribonuclease n=1 Tax=Paenarthrobacter sp. DKR-5 TaxID=2835535 RepID=UPI001BDD7331|nr:Rne/Rng family ribonuclease [Paenarthrobacter sp. DKR-5]MBT1003838.1 Rne/Rng family ribonuclease [Paenarthrobacter sp. DKR-5]